VYNPQATYMP
jgi:hypothetical protein